MKHLANRFASRFVKSSNVSQRRLWPTSQGQGHLPGVVDRWWTFHGYDYRLSQLNSSLLAQSFIGSRQGYSCPSRRIEEALREPKGIRLCHARIRTKRERFGKGLVRPEWKLHFQRHLDSSAQFQHDRGIVLGRGIMFYGIPAALLLASNPPAEPAIDGYYYDCSATLQLTRGKIRVKRSLKDDGKTLFASDTANWEPADYRSGFINWSAPAWRNDSRLSETIAAYTNYVTTERRLPKVSSWELTRPQLKDNDQFALTMTTQAQPRMGSVTAPLRVILAFVGSETNIRWVVSDVQGQPNGTRREYAEGYLDGAALREAAEALPKSEALLDEMAAAPAKKCKLTPIYYSPYAEI